MIKFSQRLRRIVALALSLALLSPGFLLAAAVPKKAKPTEGGANVSFLRGQANWSNLDGKTGTVSKGLALSNGSTVTTAESSVLKLKLHDGNDLVLGPNTQITVNSMKVKSLWVNQVSFFGGRLRGIVHKLRGGDRLEIMTTNAVAAVKGTDFIMDLPTGPNANVRVMVLSSASIGMYLASKNGKTGVQVLPGTKVMMSPLGTVAAGKITAKDVDAANADSAGAVAEVPFAASLAKVQFATEAKFVMLEAMDAQLAIVAQRQEQALAAIIALKGEAAPEVLKLKEAQKAQAEASLEYVNALTEGVKKMAELDQKIADSIAKGVDPVSLLAERKLVEAETDNNTKVLIEKVDKTTKDAQGAAGSVLPPEPVLGAPTAFTPAPTTSSLAQLAQTTLQQVQQEQARQLQQDQQTVKNDAYTGANYIDRNNVRVQVSQVVLRPDAATVQKVQFTQRSTGPQAGQSVFSHSMTFNQALPEDWAPIARRSLNDPANLGGGSPAYFRLSEQIAMRSPSACMLCLTQQYDVPTLDTTWKQGVTERTSVQGVDVGYVHYGIDGLPMVGSDNITVAVTEDTVNKNWQFVYTNVTLGVQMFTAKVWLIDGAGGFTAPGAFATAPTSLRSFNLGFDGKFFEMSITAPGFGGQEIDVVVPSPAFLDAFKKGN